LVERFAGSEEANGSSPLCSTKEHRKYFKSGDNFMYAIVRTGGKQYKVKPGDKFTVEKLEGNKGDSLKLEEVLFISEENDSDPMIGKPLVDGAKVDCEIVAQARTKKTIVFKFHKRKRYMRSKGHRQELTMLKVKSVACGSKNWKAEESK